jgi:hypothetical protein
MEPKKVGRALGIGVRVASKMVQKRVAEASAGPSSPPGTAIPVATPGPATNGSPARATAVRQAPARTGNRAATAQRGLKAFGQAFLGPFTHAGSILWLEITGLFFALFTLFFAQSAYRARGFWRSGPDHLHFWLYVILTLGFTWFSGSSFLRAYRKGQRGPVSRPRA